MTILFRFCDASHNFFEESCQRQPHFIIYLSKPNIYFWILSDIDWFFEVNNLSFSAEHTQNQITSLSLLILESSNTSIHLSEVLLDNRYILTITNDFKQIIISHEVETCKGRSLGLEVVT